MGPAVPIVPHTPGPLGSHGAGRPPVCEVARPAGPAASSHGVTRNTGHAAAMVYQSYDDPDIGNPLPAFTPSRPTGIHFGQPLLRRTMTKAIEFFHLFFTVEMINSICKHTNTYANEHMVEGTHQTYAQADGSLKDTTPDEINRLIALLIYFGLVKVNNAERY